MSLLFAFLAFAQVGPFTKPGPQPVSPLPPEVLERQEQARRRPPAEVPLQVREMPKPQTDLDRCLAAVNEDPLQTVEYARAWLQTAKGVPASQAGHCLGVALGRLERWGEAHTAFADAREMAVDSHEKARLGSMAGNAALAAGDAKAALAALDAAHGDALVAVGRPLAGDIAIDRARALVALGRNDEAAAALAEARTKIPRNPQAWLLSATLSRRMGKLAEAQVQIQQAAELMPVDPDIGLEAGVIAVLSGRDAAARKSWQSVIDAAPKSAAAATAKSYLAQLGPEASAKP